MKELPKLFNDNFNAFEETCFNVFDKNTIGVSCAMHWIRGNFGRYVVENLAGKFSREEQIRLLAVGSGRGRSSRVS